MMQTTVSVPSNMIDIQMRSSPEHLSLLGARRIAGIAGQTHVEILGTYPDVSIHQSGSGFTRLTSLNPAAKWSNDPYRWCVGSAGFAIGKQNNSFLVHAVTHGNAMNTEAMLQQQYRDHVRRMLDSIGNPSLSDVVIFGGTNPSEHQKNCSNEIRRVMRDIIEEESRGVIRPLIIPPLQQDTMKSPIPKRVLVDTEKGRLFYFEAVPQKILIDRSYCS